MRVEQLRTMLCSMGDRGPCLTHRYTGASNQGRAEERKMMRDQRGEGFLRCGDRGSRERRTLPVSTEKWVHLPPSASSLGRPGVEAGALDSPCSPDPHPQLATSSFLLFLLMGTVSVAFLLLPLQDELGSQLPQILHVSLGQKLVAAYVLGEPSGSRPRERGVGARKRVYRASGLYTRPCSFFLPSPGLLTMVFLRT